MNDESIWAFLADQPLLLLTMLAVLAGAFGWRLQESSPGTGRMLRNTAYLAMLSALLLTVAQVTMHNSRSDAAMMLVQDQRISTKGTATLIPMGPDGHFWVKAEINGHEVDCMIDTGATFVSLSKSTAETAGVRPREGEPPIKMDTANGTTLNRLGTAGTIRFGTIDARNVEVAIAGNDESDTNVIGMNLLSKLGSWSVEGKVLKLQP